jgi:hypothetical protein
LVERRNGKRFQLEWNARLNGISGEAIVESASIVNLSSRGALLKVPRSVEAGSKVDVYIQLPMKSVRWMKFSARVLRVSPQNEGLVAALRFDGSRPAFITWYKTDT